MPAERLECAGEPTFSPEGRLSAGKRTLTRWLANVGNVPRVAVDTFPLDDKNADISAIRAAKGVNPAVSVAARRAGVASSLRRAYVPHRCSMDQCLRAER